MIKSQIDKLNKEQDIKWLSSLNINAFRLIPSKIGAGRKDLRMIDERNVKLYALFRLFYARVQLVGIADNPIICVDNELGIPCYVKNFVIYFTKKWNKDSPTIAQFNLTEELCLGYDSRISELEKVLEDVELFPIYTIQDNNGYYFTGYNKDPEGEMSAVYSKVNPRVYVSHRKALESANQIKETGEQVVILKAGQKIL